MFSYEFCEHLSKNTFFYRKPANEIRHERFFVNILKISEKRFFDVLQEFSKSLLKFAKYLSADGCFVKRKILLRE